jgi:hypothetical protein
MLGLASKVNTIELKKRYRDFVEDPQRPLPKPVV